MENEKLYDFFKPFWSADTSYSPENWSSENPSLGQCAPTVLVIQDYLGGEIVKGKIYLKDGTIETHFWNNLEDKDVEVDATRFQYADNIKDIIPKPALSLREDILSYPDTKRRYDLLRNAVDTTYTKEFFSSLRLSL